MIHRRFDRSSRDHRRTLRFESLEERRVLSVTVVNAPLEESDVIELAPQPDRNLPLSVTNGEVPNLPFWRFDEVTLLQMPLLTPQQISTIPDIGAFYGEWPEDARRWALNLGQVQALNVATVQLLGLSDLQREFLTTAQVESLFLQDFPRLPISKIPLLTPAQIATIPDIGAFFQMSAAQRAVLTKPQVQALQVATVQLQGLTALQISWLTTAQIQTLTQPDFRFLSPSQIPDLTPDQIALIPDNGGMFQLSAAQRAALTQPQVQALNIMTIRIDTLLPDQIAWLTESQIQKVILADYHLLWPDQIPSLSIAQIMAADEPVTFGQQFTVAQRGALTQPQIQAMNVQNTLIGWMTSEQIGWLTVPQIQQVILVEYPMLAPSQIHSLSLAQIMAADQNYTFAQAFSADQQAALTQPQIQAMNVQNTLIGWMTAEQIGWLTVPQIQQVILVEYPMLAPSQIPSLSLAQIMAADQNYTFAQAFSVAQQAALSQPQIQVMNVQNTLIYWMTALQRSWLTEEQITQLRIEEIPYLSDDQIPFLSISQFANMAPGVLGGFSDAVKASLPRAKLMAMPLDVLSGYMIVESTQNPPAGYIPAIHEHPDPTDPLGLPHTHDTTALEAFALLSPTDPSRVYAIVNNGNWSSPSTWSNNAVPAAGAKVYIPPGKTVVFDTVMTQAVKIVRVDGTLTFKPDVNTTLRADTIVVYTTGTLHIGTETAPIADNVTAKILIPSGTPIDTVWDPNLVSRGLISRGEVRMFGRYVTPYASLAIDPAAGATSLTFTQPPVGWRVGDELYLAGTNYPIADYGSERVTITAVNGAQVTLNRGLTYAHDAPDGMGLTVQVANTNRNIQFIGEGDPNNLYLVYQSDPILAAQYRLRIQERPHMMFIDNPDVQVENILVQGFGRTDKDVAIVAPVVIGGVLVPGTGTNTRARYSLHFHHTGVNPAYDPAVIRNNVVVGSPGWGFVNHQSNVVMEYNVSLAAVGAGFVAEDGNEIGLMRGNFAMLGEGSDTHDHILSRRANHDFGHTGHGFWFQGPGIEVVDNIVANTRSAAYAYQTASSVVMYDTVNLTDPSIAEGREAIPVGVAPLKGFRGNTAYAVDTGVEMWFHQTNLNEGASEIVDFTSWGAKQSGVQLFYTGHVKFIDAVMLGRFDIPNTIGVSSNRFTHDIVFDNLRLEGYDAGLVVPPRRSTIIEGGRFSNVRNLVIGKSADTIRSLDVTEPITFVTPTPAQLAGRQAVDVSVTQQWQITDNLGRKAESLFSADDLRIKMANGQTLQLYYADQAASFIPFPTAPSISDFQSGYVGKTNLQLSQLYGKWFNGGDLPAGAYTPSGFVGFAVIETAALAAADFNGDSSVDGRDFLDWQRNVGALAAVKTDGDADGDRDVDAEDLALWADDYGFPGAALAGAPASAAVVTSIEDNGPEPTAADLAYAAMAHEQMTAATPKKNVRPRRLLWRGL